MLKRRSIITIISYQFTNFPLNSTRNFDIICTTCFKKISILDKHKDLQVHFYPTLLCTKTCCAALYLSKYFESEHFRVKSETLDQKPLVEMPSTRNQWTLFSCSDMVSHSPLPSRSDPAAKGLSSYSYWKHLKEDTGDDFSEMNTLTILSTHWKLIQHQIKPHSFFLALGGQKYHSLCNELKVRAVYLHRIFNHQINHCSSMIPWILARPVKGYLRFCLKEKKSSPQSWDFS